nr:MAG TPA: Repressor protein CI [Caudoviricetes sp.]
MGAVEKMANYFGIAKSVIVDDVQPTPTKQPTIPPGFEPMPAMDVVPLVGRIACGTPIMAEENIEQMVCVPSRWHSTFTLTCKGDSMEPRIHDGDLVAIRSQPEVENGEIAAVRIGEEATLKHVYLHENFIELRPENPAFGSIILNREDMNTVVIEGKAVGLCRDI